MLSSLSSHPSIPLVFSTAPPDMTICLSALWVRFDLLTKAESQLRSVPEQTPTRGHCFSLPTEEKTPQEAVSNLIQDSATAVILLLTLLISALILFSFFQFSADTDNSPTSVPLGLHSGHGGQPLLLVQTGHKCYKSEKQRESSMGKPVSAQREDNHFPPPQRPFLPRIPPKSQWQQRQKWRNSNSSNLDQRRCLSSSWDR